MNPIKVVLTFLFICIYINVESQTDSNFPKKTINILFVGNSLTYTNNLPLLVKKQAKLKGINIKTKMLAYPNYAIVDHWREGDVQKEILSKTYDFVIIQQGPSSQNDGRQMLFEDGKKYSVLCKNNNAKLVYFMVWPPKSHPERFDGVMNNYRDAAKINNAILCPVGEVWKNHFDTTNNFDYYGADGFHPSKRGSKIAARTIVEILFFE